MNKKAKLEKVYVIPHLPGFIILDGELKAVLKEVQREGKIHVTYRNLTKEEKRRYGIIKLPNKI